MPRSLTFRNAIAAITMAVAALCGGGKAVAQQKGTLTVAEVRVAPAPRADTRKRQSDVVVVDAGTEIIATDRAEDSRATAADRAALPDPVSPVIESGGRRARALLAHQVTGYSVCIRPPTRAPPHGAANRLADGSGCA